MASAQGPPGGPPEGPPFAPQNASLGGLPSTIPDVPVTAVFLFLYVVFAATHMKIMKTNEARGHKFNFSGALFGFCAVRVVTMSLRIAWSQHTRNISLGIAAQVFVYVGTIILYIVNWFFAQRIVRAQHPRFGWSTPYRILFRAAIGCLILSLIMLVIGAIQQFFTRNTNALRIDRDLQLAGQTYFGVLCFAPIVVVLLSLIVPQKSTEKFGAGRFSNNIAILLISTVILSIGQIFRVVSAWLPPTPLRNAQGEVIAAPWYYSKACFYTLNFTTEFLVIFLYAVVRVDLRFHVPDGSSKPGDYSSKPKTMPKKDRSSHTIDVIGKEKNLKRFSRPESVLSNASKETLHQYESSMFDDTQTLADSLRYPSTVLEIDTKSGNWKVKRASRATSVSSVGHSGASVSNMSQSNLSRHSSNWDNVRHTWVDGDAPPVPSLAKTEWPLRESQAPPFQVPVMEHRNRASRRASRSPAGSSRFAATPGVEVEDAIDAAIAKLEANSATRKSLADSDAISVIPKDRNSISSKSGRRHRYRSGGSSSSIPATPSRGPLNKTSTSTYATAQSELPSSEGALAAEMISSHQSSHGGTMNTEDAQREFDRFSYEAPPMQRSLSETEKDKERK